MMRMFGRFSLAGLLLIMLNGCTKKESGPSPEPASQPGTLHARAFNSGFESAHDTYNGMLAASDGKIYYVLSSAEYNIAGQIYAYDPATGAITGAHAGAPQAGEYGGA